MVYHQLVVLALGSRTRNEIGSRTLAGRSRDDTLDFGFDGQTCQRMTTENDNPQLGSRTLGLLKVRCCVAWFFLDSKPTQTAASLFIQMRQP